MRQLNFLKSKKLSDTSINNDISNRGVDYILSGGKVKKQDTHSLTFGKIINFFKREIHIFVHLSLGIKK